jgi:CubicO group peptidase (beta-lactamase class C family)
MRARQTFGLPSLKAIPYPERFTTRHVFSHSSGFSNAASSLVPPAEDYAGLLSAVLRHPKHGWQQIAMNEYLEWGVGGTPHR